MATAPPARRRVSVLLAVILLVAIALGIAATFLSAPVQPAPSAPPQDRTGNQTPLLLEGFAGLIIGLVIVLLLLRATGGRSPGVSRYAGTALAVLTVGVLFAVLLHFVASGGNLGNATAQNGTTGPGTSPNGTVQPVNNSTGPILPFPPLPSWAGYVGLAVAAIVAVVLIVPLSRLGGTARMETEGLPSGPARRSFEAALKALEPGATADPRAIIIALYAELLQVVTPYLAEVDSATPREIELECVRRLHIQSAHARALTGLFEEARYSSHPFTESQVHGARSALSAALADLKAPSGGSR